MTGHSTAILYAFVCSAFALTGIYNARDFGTNYNDIPVYQSTVLSAAEPAAALRLIFRDHEDNENDSDTKQGDDLSSPTSDDSGSAADSAHDDRAGNDSQDSEENEENTADHGNNGSGDNGDADAGDDHGSNNKETGYHYP